MFFDLHCNFDNRYVHNNIFFSFAIDADLEKLSKKHGDGNSKTCCAGTLQSSSDKASYVRPHGDSLVPNGGKTDGSSLEDVNSTETTQDVSPEAQLAENEQATYASANNDLKGTKAYQEADVPGLYNLAMAIIDYRGHRVVAQVCSTAQIHLFLIYSFFLSVGSVIILLYVQLSKKHMYDYLVILPMLFLFGLDNMV
jgi:hypothetical protein